jgi:quinol monooxygenase YgiN
MAPGERSRTSIDDGPHVAICADLVDPGRVNIFERWKSQAALETFRSSGPDTEQRPAIPTVSVQKYDLADVRPVFGREAE